MARMLMPAAAMARMRTADTPGRQAMPFWKMAVMLMPLVTEMLFCERRSSSWNAARNADTATAHCALGTATHSVQSDDACARAPRKSPLARSTPRPHLTAQLGARLQPHKRSAACGGRRCRSRGRTACGPATWQWRNSTDLREHEHADVSAGQRGQKPVCHVRCWAQRRPLDADQRNLIDRRYSLASRQSLPVVHDRRRGGGLTRFVQRSGWNVDLRVNRRAVWGGVVRAAADHAAVDDGAGAVVDIANLDLPARTHAHGTEDKSMTCFVWS
eukprot:3931963-Rhodomonas_salina.1